MTGPTLSILGIATKGNELRLQYAVTNPRQGKPIFLLNLYNDAFKQLHPPPRSEYSPELAPTCYTQQDEVLLFMAGVVPRSARPGISFYAPILPLAARVAAGERFEGTIRTVVPVAEWSPYEEPVRSGPNVKMIEARKIRLVVEYVPEEQARVKEPHPRHPGAFRVSPQPATMLRAEIAPPHPVPVLKRTDEFPRFGPVDNAPPAPVIGPDGGIYYPPAK